MDAGDEEFSGKTVRRPENPKREERKPAFTVSDPLPNKDARLDRPGGAQEWLGYCGVGDVAGAAVIRGVVFDFHATLVDHLIRVRGSRRRFSAWSRRRDGRKVWIPNWSRP